jgi:hypothetical protein
LCKPRSQAVQEAKHGPKLVFPPAEQSSAHLVSKREEVVRVDVSTIRLQGGWVKLTMVSSEREDSDSAHPKEGEDSLNARTTAEQKPAGSLPASNENAPSKQPSKARKRRSASEPDDVSRVLRGVYDDTLREQVPDDFRDLLGKLS